MALTLARLRKHVSHAIQGGVVPSLLDQDDIVNDAGRLMLSLHPWNFRNKPPVILDFIADVEYVELPADFGEMVAYQMTDGLNFGISMNTAQTVANRRSTTLTVSQNHFWATLVFPSQVTPESAPPPPRLELWPTPSATSTGVLSMWYRSKWKVLGAVTIGGSTDNDLEVADVPDYAEMALIEIVRAVSAGWSERLLEPSGGVTGLMDLVVGGRIWGAATSSDYLVQSDYGVLSGGAIEAYYPKSSWRSATASPVANPS